MQPPQMPVGVTTHEYAPEVQACDDRRVPAGLLHRDPAGTWRSVALPADVQPGGPVFAAMTGTMSELVVVGARGGDPVVLATAARAQAAG